MRENKRALIFYQELKQLMPLDKIDWEIYSGEFNRRLRNAIMCAYKKEKVYLKYMFNYWQIQNQMRNTNVLDIGKINELNRQCDNLKKEIFNEKEYGNTK